MAKKKEKTAKIKMLISMAATDFSHEPGKVLEVSEEVAIAWVEAGIAELAKGEE
jgi:hypothetical protein